MKQFVLAEPKGPDGLKLVEIERPEPGPHEVLVKLHAASLNRRDLFVVQGRYGRAPLKPNLVPLSDGAGEVVMVGHGVTRVKQGQRVAGTFTQAWYGGELTQEARGTVLGGGLDGVLAEYRVFDEEGLVHIPDHLSYEEAATLPCAGLTAWHALFEQKPLQPGNTVLILGTGGVAIFALQFAKLAGAVPIVISSSDEKLARAKALGAAHTVNYKSVPEWGAEVRTLTGGRGVDLVVEIGGSGTLQRSLDAVRMGGHIALLGVLTGKAEIDPGPFLQKSCSVKGLLTGPRDMFERMNRAIAAHKLKPVIDRVFGFAQAAEALRYLEASSFFGKIAIRIAGS
jgi:NADPH:quinone reductase-like Zn-dependent oxidoreductase